MTLDHLRPSDPCAGRGFELIGSSQPSVSSFGALRAPPVTYVLALHCHPGPGLLTLQYRKIANRHEA
jgi:hypothetical protein